MAGTMIARRIQFGARAAFAALAAGIVVWSFCVVIGRWWAGEPGQRDGKVHITMLQWGDNEETALLRSVLDRFEEAHPGVRVDLMQTPNFDLKVFTMTAGGMPPDVFYVTDDNISIWSQLGLLRDLDPLIAEDAKRGGDKWLRDFYPHLLDWFKFDGRDEGRGPQYALPTWHTPFVMFVNKDLFGRAGLEVPRGGWTWEQYDEAVRRISALAPADDPARRTYGAAYTNHQYATRSIIWNHGGRLFGGEDRDEEHLALGEAGGLAALKRIQRLRFAEGAAYAPPGVGFASQGGKDRSFELFATGRVGVYGPDGYWANFQLVKDRVGFGWEFVPTPCSSGKGVSASVAIGWAVAARSKHPREAFEVVKFMTGDEGQKPLVERGLILSARRSLMESPDFLDRTPGPPKRLWLEATNHGRIPYWPRIKPFLGRFFDNLNKVLVLNNATAEQAAAKLAEDWAIERRAPRNRPGGEPMPWRWILAGAAVVLAVAGGVACRRLARRQRRGMGWREEAGGWLFISPWLAGFVVFTLGPMLASLAMSFTQWTPLLPLESARWAGANNYLEMFTSDARFPQALKVTLYYTLLAVPFTQAVALLLAALLNASTRGVGVLRSLFFMPSLIGGVVLAALGLWVFNKEFGLLNAAARPITDALGVALPDWLGADAHRWGVPALVLMSVWSVGGAMVIYLAALKGVPAELYEAARIDGASRLQQFRRITLPMISPIVQFNLIMGLIGSFQVFTVIMVLTGGGPDNATLTYAVYIYEEAFQSLHMGYASALAWVLFLIVLAVTLAALRSMRRFVYYEGLR